MKSRKYDVVLWGASGFTGKLVAEYLSRKYGVNKELKWAIAGRNKAKLESLRASLDELEIPIIIADSKNRKSLDDMVSQTKVICSTVGPYALYGSELVASCVANHTDYCDLTGEVQWMRKMIDQYHHAAVRAKVKIVHTCGFDSIPSDMGVFFIQEEAKKLYGNYLSQIKMRLKAAKGGMSGGTYESLKNVMVEAAKEKEIYQVLINPYSLNPDEYPDGLDKPDLRKVEYDEDLDTWISPFIMATINTKVVRRSHALKGLPYGKDFQYDEAVMTGKGMKGKVKSIGSIMAIGALMAGKPGSMINKAVSFFLPKAGEGPGKKERENGFYNFVIWGKTIDGQEIKGSVKGDMDPGYGSTSKMLGESAVCLALDQGITPKEYGMLTPSVAMGSVLLERLIQNAGLKFEIKN